MSQASLAVSTVSPLSGLNVVLTVNGAVKAIATMQSSTAAPTRYSTASTALLEGQLWLDKGPAVHLARLYNGANFTPSFINNGAPDAAFLYANFGVL